MSQDFRECIGIDFGRNSVTIGTIEHEVMFTSAENVASLRKHVIARQAARQRAKRKR